MNFLKSICFFTVILLVAGSFAFAGEPLPGNGDKSDLPTGVSGDWWTTVQKNIRDGEYNLSQASGEKKALYQAPNRAQGFRSFFSEKGVRLVPRTDGSPAWEWGLEIVQKTEGGRLKAEVSARDNRIEIDRGNITEWYVNDENGLEQGFTVLKPSDKSGKLHIDMKLTGSLRPKFAGDGQAVDFYGNGSLSVLTYSKLKVTDASGRLLPARFEGINGGIRIVADDRGARYPVTIDPLATSPAWTAEGNQVSAQFGCSVATAGDVNGDGYSDVIVGAYQYDNGENDEGAAYVYYGSASGLNTTPLILESNQASAWFGWSVATAGDVNGDGYSDVIVGAERSTYAYHGSPTGLSATASWIRSSDQFQCSVATAGDVNGDGFSDVIVGEDSYVNGEDYEGAAFVFLGSASGLSTTPSWTAEGNQANAYFGRSVATAGDVNGDGYSDIIVGAIGYANGQIYEGRAFVYLGSASGPAASAGWTAEGDQVNAYFGCSVGTAGDVNGDGYSDIIVGALFYYNDEAYEGRAFVYLGSASGPAASAVWMAEGNQANAYFGNSVGTAGDVNGDGYSDIIVGSYQYDNGETDEGRAFVYLGSASGLNTTPLILESNQASAHFGYSAATAGDVNGDGFSDVIVGADYYTDGESGEGAAFLYLGGAASLITGFAWSPGVGVVAGDVNGDGYGDVIVGDPTYSNPEVNEGAVYVYYGSAAGLSTTPAWMIEGGEENAELGTLYAAAGDVNGDGYGDVLVTTYAYFDPTTLTYFAPCLYLGGPSGLSSTPAWVGLGNDTPPDPIRMDADLLSAGDVNGDGYWDVVVASFASGRTLVYFGGASGLPALPDRILLVGDSLLLAAGDVNRDGYSDLLGFPYLYLGTAFGPGYAPAVIAAAVNPDAYAAPAGDVNGDGYSDILVVDTWATRPETPEEPWTVWQAGAVYLYLGGSSGPATSPSSAVYGQCEDAQFPDYVAEAGDVNGDGYADLFVGYDPSLHDPPGVCDPNWPQEQLALYLGGPSGFPSSPSWTAADIHSGGTVGDPNGDGYSDVLVGGLLYYGNGGPCLTSGPVQRRADDSAPVAPLGSIGETGSFLAGLTGRTPFGRGEFKLEWEAKPLGTPFNGSGAGMSTSWLDTGLAGQYREDLVTGLAVDTVYHWRVRPRYNPVTTPFQTAGRWVSIPWNGPGETDLRTGFGEADVWVTQTDSDPAMVGGPLVYTMTVGNAGSDPARLLLEGAKTQGTSTFVSAIPSQGHCDYSEALGLSCDLGAVANGATATVAVTFTPTAADTHGFHAEISSFAQDLNPANNASDETTTVIAPAIGNFIWADADGDGIQDAGEPGIAGVIVQLYDSEYSWLAQKVTNSSGFYQFTAVTVGNSYFVKVILPSANYVFSQPDQGGDDTLDSDVDTVTGQSPIFSLADGLDPVRWDAGLVYGIACEAPDEPVWIYLVTLSDPDEYPILSFQDPNQPTQRTGYNVRRSDDPSLTPKSSWPIVCSNCVDMDQINGNYQWTDTSGDTPSGGVWYYLVTAYNAYCPAEGPFSNE